MNENTANTSEPAELLRAAETGAARCYAHGHGYENNDNEPVVIEDGNGGYEVMCRSCAEFYDHPIVKS